MQAFLEMIYNSYDILTFPIFSALCGRLSLSVSPKIPNKRFGRMVESSAIPLDSQIVSELPSSIFAQFKSFLLLYRGSRDGFKASAFHRLCDGQSMTVTIVLTTNGNIFGGFTPIAWRNSGNNLSDAQGESFMFSLKNPSNIAPRRFVLRDRERAIYCTSSQGPDFGITGNEMLISDNCNTMSCYCGSFGTAYHNDTGIDSATFLDGNAKFLVQEIEVFKVSK
jgi:hypothetical protein